MDNERADYRFPEPFTAAHARRIARACIAERAPFAFTYIGKKECYLHTRQDWREVLEEIVGRTDKSDGGED